MGEFILETKNLSKQYGQQMAVDGISLKIRENTVYGLLGPNGAGKSTTLKMLVGLIRPTNGQIMFDGKKWNRNCLTRIGALIETPALYGNLTAEENLLVHTELLGIPTVEIGEKSIGLTKREFDIVELLAHHAGQVFSKEQIYEYVWGYDSDGDSATVVERIKKIRAKFAAVMPEKEYISTVWGIGYKWNKM